MQGIGFPILLASILLWIFGHGVWATIGMVGTVVTGGLLLVSLALVAFVFFAVSKRVASF